MTEFSEQVDRQLRMLVPINGLSHQQQTELIHQSEVVTVKKGRYAFKRGDTDPYSFYVLEGELELSTDASRVKNVKGGSEAAKMALSQLQPRQLSAKALSSVKVLRVDRGLLDRVLTLQDSHLEGEMEVAEIDGEESVDWMTRMLQSELFARIPAANIQGIFTRMEEFEAEAGEVIVQQGTPGDYYYVIQRGRCAITRRASAGANEIRLAELSEGDSFGEEALVSHAKRNASVSMLTDGALMRLTKNDFIELIRTPALTSVSYAEAAARVEQGAKWLDIRFPDELSEVSIDGALNIPLNVLRMQRGQLKPGTPYVVVCDSGMRSSAGAFLLTELGFEVAYLDKGLQASVVTSGAGALSGADADGGGTETPPPALTSTPVTREARGEAAAPRGQVRHAVAPGEVPHPSSSGNGVMARPAAVAAKPLPMESTPAGTAASSAPLVVESESPTMESVKAEVRVSALSTELAKAKLELEEALRSRAEADARAQASETDIAESFRLERERITHEAARAIAELKEAQRLKLDAIAAKRASEATEEKLRAAQAAAARQQAAEQESIRLARERSEELERRQHEAIARAEQEQARVDEEAKRQLEAAQAEKEAADRARLAAESMAAEEVKRVERERGEELERVRVEAERVRVEELERVRVETERRIEEEANRRFEQALAQKVAAEEARRQAAEEAAEAKIDAERQRRAQEAARAEAAFDEAKRLKLEIEQAKLAAEKEAEALRRSQEERIREVEAQAEARLRENEAKLEQAFSKNAEQLANSQQLRIELEEQFTAERERIEREAEDAKHRLEDARKISSEAESAKRGLEREVKRQLAMRGKEEEKLRIALDQKLREERNRLERQWAQSAQQLEQAQREKEVAEAGRHAAQEEAQRIIGERERAHQQTRAAEEARFQTERKAMQAQAQRVSEELAQARKAKEDGERLRAEVEAQAKVLQEQKRDQVREAELQEQIRQIEGQVEQANSDLEAAERAQQIATAEQAAQDSELQKKLEETERLRGHLEEEAEAWLAEQNLTDPNGTGMNGDPEDLRRISARANNVSPDSEHKVLNMLDEIASQLDTDK